MPDEYYLIDEFMFNHLPSLTLSTFNIPSTVREIKGDHMWYNFGGSNFKNFTVDSENEYFKEVDGVLFSKDGTRLIAVPTGKDFDGGKYYVPEGVTDLGSLSFSRNTNLKTLVLPDSYEISIEERFVNKGNSLLIAVYVYTGITDFEVKDTNARYYSFGGSIYEKDTDTLIAVPVAKRGTIAVKEGTKKIFTEAFWKDALEKYEFTSLILPSSIEYIPDDLIDALNAFSGSKTFIIDDNENYAVSDGKIIKL